jgi:RimJ/RimL family protein N-acetyltransferase
MLTSLSAGEFGRWAAYSAVSLYATLNGIGNHTSSTYVYGGREPVARHAIMLRLAATTALGLTERVLTFTQGHHPVTMLETERLTLRYLTPTDALFMINLLNDPGWLRYIGDRGVHTREEAIRYIETGPMRMYAQYGFGLYLIQRTVNQEPIGICGLVKRDFLDDIDLGFALLERYQGVGYAREAASGVLHYAASVLKLTRIVAITTTDNDRSAKLLETLGLRFERMVIYPGETHRLRLFARSLTDVGGIGRS